MSDYKTKEDICSHLGDEYDRYLGAIVPPIFQNSLFTRKNQDHGYSYTRASNPTIEIAEQKIAALEEGEAARCFSSGMAAISAAIMYHIDKDSHVIMVSSAYGPAKTFAESYMNKFGVEVTYVKGDNIEDFEEAIRPNTKLIYLESPSSLIFMLQDLKAIATLAKSHGISTVIDNTWSTPLFQNPLKFGIDMVVHSATKYMGGHSDIIAGVVIGTEVAMDKMTHYERGLLGASMDPHQAWLLIRGLRTLPLRMKQHYENALNIARYLEKHPKIDSVIYPALESHPQYELGKKQMCGYSGLFSFIMGCDSKSAQKLINELHYFQVGPSWGGFESLITGVGVGIDENTSKTTGIPQGLLRVSIGLENVDSLIEDFDTVLKKI